MPNYTFKMGRLFIDVHYDAALLWIERCNDSRVLFYEIRRPAMSYVLASTLRMDCARAMNNSVSLTSLVEVI